MVSVTGKVSLGEWVSEAKDKIDEARQALAHAICEGYEVAAGIDAGNGTIRNGERAEEIRYAIEQFENISQKIEGIIEEIGNVQTLELDDFSSWIPVDPKDLI